MLAFGIGPAVYALIISFAEFEKGKPKLFAAGLSNYITAYTDFRFVGTLVNMGKYLLYALPLMIVGVVVISLLLHARPGRFSTLMRTIYFIPGAVTGPTAVLLVIFVFDPRVSPFQTLLNLFSFEALRAPHMPLVFALMLFFSAAGGWVAIFFGALNNISQEVIEAAIIDGCGAFQIANLIKRPLIAPYVVYMVILTFAGNIQLFTEPQLISLAEVVPITKYWSPNQLSYAFAFELGNFGASAALSLLMVLIGLAGAALILTTTDIFRAE